LEKLIQRDRVIVLAGLLLIAAVGWGYLVQEARGMNLTGVCCCAGMKMSGPDASPWSGLALIPLFLMWSEMMVVMMLPSAAPTLLLFASVNRRRLERQEPFVPVTIFLLGYLTIWTLFSAGASLIQWAMHGTALLSPLMVGTSPRLGALILIVAGVFQWTPFKRSCLSHCHSPLTFLLKEWKEGRRAAFAMGLKHGAYCTGCCWALMLILFVVGVMSIAWVAALTMLVLIEKTLPKNFRPERFTGLILIAWGIWLLGQGFGFRG
jgi:predicted metal-binding membrane protein